MGFKQLANAIWQRDISSDEDILTKKLIIEDSADCYIFKCSFKSGYINSSQTGDTAANAATNNTEYFEKIFTGQSSIIVQMDGCVHLDALSVPEIINNDNIDKIGASGKAPESADINSIKTFVEIDDAWDLKLFSIDHTTLVDQENNTYTWDGTDFVIKDSENKITKAQIKEAILDTRPFPYTINIKDTDLIGRSLEDAYTKWYTKGVKEKDWFMGVVDSMGQESLFKSGAGSAVSGEVMSLLGKRDFQVYTTSLIGRGDLFKLYFIPQKTDENSRDDVEYLYISNCQTYFTPDGVQAYSVLTLTSLNDMLAETGQTIKGMIMPSAPGEGYARPRLIYDDKGKAIDWDIDPDYTPDIGVRSCQIDFLGLSALSSIKVFGRPVVPGKINKIYPSRQLFLEDLKCPISFADTNKSEVTTQFYFSNMYTDIESYYGSYKEQLEAEYNDAIKKTFFGWLRSAGNTKKDLTNSNPDNKVIYDITWKITKDTFVTSADYDIRTNPYYNILQTAFSMTLESKVIKFVQWALNRNIFNFFKDIYGTANSKSYLAYEMINHISNLFTHITSMPITNTQQLAYGTASFGSIGGFFMKLLFGFSPSFRYIKSNVSSVYPKYVGLPFFIPKSFADWYMNSYWSTNDNATADTSRIPLTAFKNDSNDDLNSILDINSLTTSFAFNLTDKLSGNSVDTKFVISGNSKYADTITLSSLYLTSPLIDKNGEQISFILNENTTFLKANTEVDYNDFHSQYYIIDYFVVNAIAQCPMRITTFREDIDNDTYDSYDIINWQTSIKTKSALTGNIRDITTVYKTSYLDDFLESDAQFVYPPRIEYPPVTDLNTKYVTHSFSEYNFRNPLGENTDTTTFTGVGEYNQTFEIDLSQLTGLISIEGIKEIYNEVNVLYDGKSMWGYFAPGSIMTYEKYGVYVNGGSVTLDDLSDGEWHEFEQVSGNSKSVTAESGDITSLECSLKIKLVDKTITVNAYIKYSSDFTDTENSASDDSTWTKDVTTASNFEWKVTPGINLQLKVKG